MATVIGGAIGYFIGGSAAVSGFFGVTSAVGAMWGARIGGLVGGWIGGPKPPTIEGPRLNDLSVQTATYGASIPRIYGTVATQGNVFWLENDKLKEVVKKKKSGGKGGGSQKVKTYTYFATFAVGLCKGPIAGVRRIWVGSKLIYDAGSSDLETIIASNQQAKGFRVYLGSETQNPDPRMQADKGVANTPAYRGLAYVVFYDYPLKDHGNSLMGAQVKVEILNTLVASFSSASMTGLEPTFWNGVAANDQALVTVKSGNTGRISKNFTAWEHASFSMPFTGIWNSVTTFQNHFHAVMNGKYATSLTGDVWTGGVMPREVEYFAMAASDMRLFVVAKNSQYAAYTDRADAPDWREVEMPDSRDWVSAATNGNGTFVALAKNAGVISVSTDNCESWSDVALPQTSTWLGVVFNGSVFFAVNGSNQPSAISSDGLTWSASKVFPTFSYVGLAADRIGGAIFVAISSTMHWSMDHADTFSTSAIPSENWIAAFAIGNAMWSVPPGAFSLRASIGVTGLSQDLGSIVQAETLQSQLIQLADINTTSLTDDVRGFRVAQPGAIRGAIDPLQSSWPFDIVQSGYQLKFIRRGAGSSVATIPAEKLDARQQSDSPGTELTLDREMDIQLPREVYLRYLDAGREYDPSEQRAERLSTEAMSRSDLDLPIVLTASEASQKAETLLYLWWLERYDATFRLPPEYLGLEPADIITVTGQWGTYVLRLTSVTYLPDGRLECSAKFHSTAVYTSNAVADTGTSEAATIGLSGPSLYRLLDIPLLSDDLNTPGLPVAMCGYTSAWPGGVVVRSSDGGQIWDDIQAFTDPVTIGFARGTIGAATSTLIDKSSRLQVDIVAGELESISELNLLNGQNTFAYGSHGRWEIIGAQNCVLQGDGSYILSDLLRGRFGTEQYMTVHQAGDVLILLTDPDLSFVSMTSGQIGQDRLYRGVTADRDIDSDTDLTFAYQGVNLTPLSPVYLNGSRHPSTNDWTLTWIRRGRVSPDWRDLVDVPIGEESESYEIEIYTTSGYTTVARTLTSTTPTVAYTSAQQVTDFGSNQSTLHVRIYQMSALVGRGYPLQTAITR